MNTQEAMDRAEEATGMLALRASPVCDPEGRNCWIVYLRSDADPTRFDTYTVYEDEEEDQ